MGGAPSFQGGLKPVYLTVFNGEVYFNGSGELWVTNGTSGWHKRTNERLAGLNWQFWWGSMQLDIRICGVIGF